MFWLYEIQRKTRDAYEGTWMNKVGERTYVRGSKQNMVEKNLTGIGNSLYCCDLVCKSEDKMKLFFLSEEQEQTLINYIDAFLGDSGSYLHKQDFSLNKDFVSFFLFVLSLLIYLFWFG